MLIRIIVLTAALAACTLPVHAAPAGRNPSGLHSHIELDCQIEPTSNGTLVARVTPRGALPANARLFIILTLPDGSLRSQRTTLALLTNPGEPVGVPIGGKFASCQANLQANLP